MKIKLQIHPLSVNHCWQGRRFKTKAYKQYETDVTYLLSKYIQQATICDFCEIHYKFYLQNWKITDADNLIKCLQDILVKKQIIQDDRLIMRYVIEKIPSKVDRIEIEIQKLKGR